MAEDIREKIMRKKTLFLILIVLTGSISLSAAEKKTLTIEAILSLPYPRELALSPDGRRIAFTIRKPDFQKSSFSTSIWMVSADGTGLMQFTNPRGSDYSPQWSPDGRYIAFLSTRPYRTEEGSEKKGTPQIWIIPTDGGEAWLLTRAPKGVESFKWSPDGKTIAYITPETLPEEKQRELEEKRKRKFDARVVDGDKFKKEIWLIDVERRKSRRLYAGDYGINRLEFSPDGKLIAYTTNYSGEYNDEQKYDIWLVSVPTGGVRQLTDFPGPETFPCFSPDGQYIAYISQTVPDIEFAQTDISLIPLKGGEPVNLTSRLDFPVSSPHWSPDGGSIYFEAMMGTHTHIYRVNVKTRKIFPVIEGRRCCYQIDFSRDGRTMCFLSEDPYSLPEITVRRKGEERRITHYSDALKDYNLGTQEIIRWRSEDGLEVEGLLIKPVGYEPGRRYPLILVVHGGPFSRFRDTFRQGYYLQLYAANGYAVLAPNPRGSSGYSDWFGQANRYDLGGMDYKDIMAGVDHVISLGIADPNRLGVIGGSYGGYMTNWIISQTDRFKAAVSMYGIFNLVTDWSNSIQPSWEKMYFGKYYWEDLTPYLKHSPSTYVTDITTPVLILHGEEDQLTFISNSKEMYQALKVLGKPAEFVIYPREGHGISREPNHIVDKMNRILGWFEKYLKG